MWSGLLLSVQEGSASHKAIESITGTGVLLSNMSCVHAQHQPLRFQMQTACLPTSAPAKAPSTAHSLNLGGVFFAIIVSPLLSSTRHCCRQCHVVVTFAGWADIPALLLHITAPCQRPLCALVQVYFEWDTAPAPLPAPSTRRPQTTGAPLTSAEPPANAPAPQAEHAG